MGAQVVAGSVLSTAESSAAISLPAAPALDRYSTQSCEEHEQLSRKLNLQKTEVLELFEQAGHNLPDLHRTLVTRFGKQVPAINRIGGIGGFAVALGIGDEFRDLVEQEYGECAGHFKSVLANFGTHGPTLYTAYRLVAGLPVSSIPTPIPFYPGKLIDALTRRLEQLPANCGGPESLLRALKQAAPQGESVENRRDAVRKALAMWLLPQGVETERCSLIKLREELGMTFPVLKGNDVSYARIVWALGLTETIEGFLKRWQETRCESATQLSQRLGFSQKGGSSVLTDMVADWAALRAELSEEPVAANSAAGSMNFTAEQLYSALKLTRETAVAELKDLKFDLMRFMTANEERTAILAPYRAKGYTELFVNLLGLGPEIKEVLEKRIVAYCGSVKLLSASLGLGKTGDAADGLADALGANIRDPEIPAGNLLDTFGWTKEEVLKWVSDSNWMMVGKLKGQLCRELPKRRPLSPVAITENVFDHPEIIWGCDIHTELSAQIRHLAATRSRSLSIIGKDLGFNSANAKDVLSRVLFKCDPGLLVELCKTTEAAAPPAGPPAITTPRVRSAAPSRRRAVYTDAPAAAPGTPRRLPGSAVSGVPKELAPELTKLGQYLDLASEILDPEKPLGDMAILSRHLIEVFGKGTAVMDAIFGSGDTEKLLTHGSIKPVIDRLNDAVLRVYDGGFAEQLTPPARALYHESIADLFAIQGVKEDELTYLVAALYARGTSPERNLEAELKLEARILAIDPQHADVLRIHAMRQQAKELADTLGATAILEERVGIAAELEKLSPGHLFASRVRNEQFVDRTIESLERDLAANSLRSFRSLEQSLNACRERLAAPLPADYLDSGGAELHKGLSRRIGQIEIGAAKCHASMRLEDLYADLDSETISVTRAATIQSEIGIELGRLSARGSLSSAELKTQQAELEKATLRIREYVLMIPLSQQADQIWRIQAEAPKRVDNVQKRLYERAVAMVETMKARLTVDRNALLKNGFAAIERKVAELQISLDEVRAKEQTQAGYSKFLKNSKFYTGATELAECLARRLNMGGPSTAGPK